MCRSVAEFLLLPIRLLVFHTNLQNTTFGYGSQRTSKSTSLLFIPVVALTDGMCSLS